MMQIKLLLLLISLLFFLNFISASNVGFTYNQTWSSSFMHDISGSSPAAQGDIDNDGDLDLISTDLYGSYIYLNNGTNYINNTNWADNLSAGGGASSFAFGDINNDGYLDLVFCGAIAPFTQIYINNGTSLNTNASWQKYVTGEDGAASSSVALGDIDNDGDLDLIFPEMGVNKAIYINNGTTFVNSSSWGQDITSNSKLSTGLIDLDNDGDLDLNIFGDSNGKSYINNGTSFVHNVSWDIGSRDEGNIAWGDIDNDGDFEAVVSGIGGIGVYDYNGAYMDETDSWIYGLLPIAWGSMMLGDYDNDGDLDFVNSGVGFSTELGENNGTAFNEDYKADANLGGSSKSSTLFGDIDNDGDLDLIDMGGWRIFISNASLTTSNTAPTPPTSFSYLYNNREIKIGWSNGSDAETISTGLYYNLMMGDSSANHTIISGIYGGGGDASRGGTAFGYYGNMMQRKNLTLKVDRLEPSTDYYWYVQTIDTGLKAGDWSSVQSFTTPADMERPNVTLNSPDDSNNSNSYNFVFNVTAWDNINLTNVSLWGNWTGTWHLNETNSSGINNTYYNFSKDLTSYGDGFYSWQIQAVDNQSNVQNSSIRTFTIDTTNPSLNLTSTNNTNSTDNTLDIEYVVSDTNLDSCWYSNDTSSTNTTLTSCANVTGVVWSEGTHNITIWTNDSAGNENSSLMNFTIDSITPSINLTSPTNNTNSTDNTLFINYTASDTNLQSCWYSNDTYSINTTLTDCTTNITLTWDDGLHNLTIWTNDSFGNENSSYILFTIDTGYPIVNLTSPVNASSWTSSSTITFSYNVSDVNIANCSLIIDSVVDQTDTTITLNTAQTFTKSMSNADYFWNINCTDSVGYINNSENRSLTVSYTAPTDDTGGGGGGGGGGSSTPVTTNETTTETTPVIEKFDVDFSTILTGNLDVEEGGIKTFSFNNQVKHSITVMTLSKESITLLITSDPITIQIKLGEIKQIDINQDDINDIEIKLISITNGVANLLLTKLEGADIVAEEELEKDALFDVKIEISNLFEVVKAGREVIAKIEAFNVNNIGQVDIVIDYYITNKKDNQTKIVEGSDTLAVEAVTSFVRSLRIPYELKSGKYLFHVDVNYQDKLMASGNAEFRVIRNYWIIAVVGVIVLFMVGAIIYLKKIERKEAKLEKLIKILKRSKNGRSKNR